MPYFTYIPFSPSNYDYLDTKNSQHFYVRNPVEGGQEFILYKNSAEPHRVDKQFHLTSVGSIFGIYRDNVSITSMAILIEYNKPIDFNYIYIPNLNRYYFVTEVTIVRTNLYEISLSIDILMSYKDGIKKLKGFIDRNEEFYDDDIIDNKRVAVQGQEIEVGEAVNVVFGTTPKYVLNTFACKLEGEVSE